MQQSKNVGKRSLESMHVAFRLSLMALFCLTDFSVADQLSKPVSANAYKAPPGFDFNILAVIDLGAEIKGMEGYGLRLVRTTVAPGAVVAMHSHDGKPQIIYILEGILTEQQKNMSPVDYGPGSVMVNTKNVTHTFYNRTATPIVYIHTAVKPGLTGP